MTNPQCSLYYTTFLLDLIIQGTFYEEKVWILRKHSFPPAFAWVLSFGWVPHAVFFPVWSGKNQRNPPGHCEGPDPRFLLQWILVRITGNKKNICRRGRVPTRPERVLCLRMYFHGTFTVGMAHEPSAFPAQKGTGNTPRCISAAS